MLRLARRGRVSVLQRQLSSPSAIAPSPPPQEQLGGSWLNVAIPVLAIAGGGYYWHFHASPAARAAADAAEAAQRVPLRKDASAPAAAPGLPVVASPAVVAPAAPTSPVVVLESAGAREARTERAALVLAQTLQPQTARGVSGSSGSKAVAAVATEKKEGAAAAAATAAPVEKKEDGAPSSGGASAPPPPPAAARVAEATVVPVAAAPPAPAPVDPVAAALLRAQAEMRALLLANVGDVIARDLSSSAASQVAALSAEQLRDRLLNEMTEKRERARLEGARLAEFMERGDALWASKARASTRARAV